MSTNTKEQSSTPANEKPPEPTAADVAKVCTALVSTLQALPPLLQLRALQSTATMLGLDKEQRSRASTTQQQRTNTNGSNQTRSGGNR